MRRCEFYGFRQVGNKERALVKCLNGKKGSYDAYLIPKRVKEYSYTKDGKEVQGFQYQLKLEFPQGK